MGLRWAVESCAKSRFYMFVDDDYYVSTRNVLAYLRNPVNYPGYLEEDVISFDENEYKKQIGRKLKQLVDFDLPSDVKLFTGYVFPRSRPQRHKWSKWFVDLLEYPYDFWPPYVTAGAYILSRDALVDMYYTSYYTRMFRFDDIWLGLIAKKAGIEPFHNNQFYFHPSWILRSRANEQNLDTAETIWKCVIIEINSFFVLFPDATKGRTMRLGGLGQLWTTSVKLASLMCLCQLLSPLVAILAILVSGSVSSDLPVTILASDLSTNSAQTTSTTITTTVSSELKGSTDSDDNIVTSPTTETPGCCQDHDNTIATCPSDHVSAPHTCQDPTVPCSSLPLRCLHCSCNYSCQYGADSLANCSTHPSVQCTGNRNFTRQYKCSYCFLTAEKLHRCSNRDIGKYFP